MTREEASFILANIDRRVCDDELNEALDIAIKALEQEPCEDVISRQAVIDVIEKWLECSGYNEAERHIMKAVQSVLYDSPPVTPQPKTGYWTQTNEFFINQDGQFIYKFICSECKSLSYFRKSNKKAIGANVCPNCGTKMVESEG